jgi:hypothetical protein
MKKLLGLVFLMFIFIAATAVTSEKPDTMHSIEGTWELQSFYFYENDEITDTVPTAEGYRQVKMYYNGKIMWSRTTVDSLGRFGFGKYRISDKQLIEKIEYGDIEMMRALDTLTEFTFELQLTDENYSQISWDEEGNRTFSENYKRID